MPSSGSALSQQNQFHQIRLNPRIIRTWPLPCTESLLAVDLIGFFRPSRLKEPFLEYSIGNPAIVGKSIRPVALRPRLSTGMPFAR